MVHLPLAIVFGTRPEWNKLRPIVRELKRRHLIHKLIYVNQHHDLIDQTIKQYECMRVDLRAPRKDEPRLNYLFSAVIDGVSDLLLKLRPECVMVQGDTTTAAASAVAAFNNYIPVAHVEAGLRTWSKQYPFPEEANRRIITSVATYHYAPTHTDSQNIHWSDGEETLVTGNTSIDELVHAATKSITIKDHVIVTLHRRENIPFLPFWLLELEECAKKYPKTKFWFFKHPNTDLSDYLPRIKHVYIRDPVPHSTMIEYLSSCKYVITDSGGLQEESSFFQKHCIVCRQFTERHDGIGRFSFLCKSPDLLKWHVDLLESAKDLIVNAPCPYGDGYASQTIVDHLEHVLGLWG